MKLMAISSRGRGRIEDLGDWWRRLLLEFLEFSGNAAARKVDCRMTRWRKSTREGSIYRTKWAGANLTYLFAALVKSKGVRVDMVTVRTIIKGLRM